MIERCAEMEVEWLVLFGCKIEKIEPPFGDPVLIVGFHFDWHMAWYVSGVDTGSEVKTVIFDLLHFNRLLFLQGFLGPWIEWIGVTELFCDFNSLE